VNDYKSQNYRTTESIKKNKKFIDKNYYKFDKAVLLVIENSSRRHLNQD
jgi:hypothetical protein